MTIVQEQSTDLYLDREMLNGFPHIKYSVVEKYGTPRYYPENNRARLLLPSGCVTIPKSEIDKYERSNLYILERVLK